MVDVINEQASPVEDTVKDSTQVTTSPAAKSSRLYLFVMLTSVATMWIATRPYFGIVHDSRFYMLEALHQINPARFASDLYFQFGSQDQFTVFAKLYLPLLPIFGIGGTS